MAEEPTVEPLAVSRVGFVSLATGTTTGWTCAIPAGAAAGDVAFTFLMTRSASAPTTVPAGYTLLDPVDTTGGNVAWLWCYAKVLQAGDPGSNHVWAWASVIAAAGCLILRGCDNGQVLDVTDPPVGVAANATTVAAPATTVTTAGSYALWAAAVGTNGTQAWPASNNGNTITRELGSASGGLGVAWASYPAAGAVAACTVTCSVSTRVVAKTLVAKLAPPPSATQRWTGSAWTPAAAVQRWSGSAWVPATVKRWNGTAWV